MREINSSLTQNFNNYTSMQDSSPGVVDPKEAKVLIDIAKDINATKTSCCSFTRSTRGDKDLRRLLENNSSKFQPEASSIISFYLKNHTLPPELPTTVVNPAVVPNTPPVVSPSPSPVPDVIPAGGSPSPINGPSTPPATSPSPEPVPSPVSPVSPLVPTDPVTEVKIGEFKCAKQTWHCHWFPQKEQSRPGGDAINNLYAKGGTLDLYDQAFSSSSRSFEKANFSKAFNTGEEYDWWGFCDLASQAASILKEPVYDVVKNGVTFTPHLISGLLVKVVPSLVRNVDFRGERYNGPSDDPNDPRPSLFLTEIMQKWGYKNESPTPFVLDIDSKKPVWNYPFDSGETFHLAEPPEGFDVATLPEGGHIKFYRMELKGTGFDEQEQSLTAWVQYKNSESEEVLADSWIGDHPDFAWRPEAKGDLESRETWVTDQRAQGNPYVRAEDVYDIYMESIGAAAGNTPPVFVGETEGFIEDAFI